MTIQTTVMQIGGSWKELLFFSSNNYFNFLFFLSFQFEFHNEYYRDSLVILVEYV